MEIASYILSIILIFLSGGAFVFSFAEWALLNNNKEAKHLLILGIITLTIGILGIIFH